MFIWTYSITSVRIYLFSFVRKKAKNIPISNLSPLLGLLCASLRQFLALLAVLGRQGRDKIPHFVPLLVV